MIVKKFVFLLLVVLCSVPSIMGMKPFVRGSRGVVSRKSVSSRVFRAWSSSYGDNRTPEAVYELATIIYGTTLGAAGSNTVAGGGTSSGTTSCARRVDQTIATSPVFGDFPEVPGAFDVRDVSLNSSGNTDSMDVTGTGETCAVRLSVGRADQMIAIPPVLGDFAGAPPASDAQNVPNSSFVKHAYGGDTRAIIESLKGGQNPNEVDQNGRTALIWAAFRGNKNMVQRLIYNTRTRVDIQDVRGFTALMVTVVYHGDPDIISLLLGAHANPDLGTFPGGDTALMFAIDTGKAGAVQLLIAAHAELDIKREKDGVTALMLAADHGDVAIVKQLLNAGANPNIQDNTGWTALMYAVRGGFRLTVQALIAARAQADLQTYVENLTALMIVAAHGRAKMAKLLLGAGANPWICDSQGKNSFSFAHQNKHRCVLRALRDYANRPVREQAACAPRNGVGLGATGGGMVLSPNASPDPVWSVGPATAGTVAV